MAASAPDPLGSLSPHLGALVAIEPALSLVALPPKQDRISPGFVQREPIDNCSPFSTETEPRPEKRIWQSKRCSRRVEFLNLPLLLL